MSFNRTVKDKEKKYSDPLYSDMHKVRSNIKRSRYMNEEDDYVDLINSVKSTRMNVSDFIDDHGCDVN
jgi:hypothetical protein